MEVFDPPIAPSITSTGSTVFDVEVVTFGNSYEQVAEKGLNARRERYMLTWSVLEVEEFEAIMAHLDLVRGDAWLYQIPTKPTQKRWRLDGAIEEGWAGGLAKSIRFPVREVFDPQ